MIITIIHPIKPKTKNIMHYKSSLYSICNTSPTAANMPVIMKPMTAIQLRWIAFFIIVVR